MPSSQLLVHEFSHDRTRARLLLLCSIPIHISTRIMVVLLKLLEQQGIESRGSQGWRTKMWYHGKK
jgi:hypothetical protein